MSRLDSFIRRMCAQRDILNSLPPRLRGLEGAIVEFGLGSGRTLDHLRACFPDRRLVVFERDVRDSPWPERTGADLLVGDIRDTAATLPDGSTALVHADIDTGDAAVDAALATWLPPLAARLLIPGGFVASSVAVPHPCLTPLALPPGIGDRRYHLARRAGTPHV